MEAVDVAALVARHRRYLRMHLDMLSHHYVSLDTSRMTALYFCVVGLDMLGCLEEEVPETERARVVEWIYGLQVCDATAGGFRGGPWFGGPWRAEGCAGASALDTGHLAMTYCALATLLTLGEERSLPRVRHEAVRRGVAALQQANGSFTAAPSGGCECDLRFVYCASAVSSLLDEPPLFDVPSTLHHIARCQAFDGGVALAPNQESHGGSTYCAVAARTLLRRLLVRRQKKNDRAAAPCEMVLASEDTFDEGRVVAWTARRHVGGFVGRVNKPPDSCYAFWLGATLRNLGAAHASVDFASVSAFVLSCEAQKTGGFAKFAHGAPPDLLHSFYSIAALSWTVPGLRPVDPLIGICESRVPNREVHPATDSP